MIYHLEVSDDYITEISAEDDSEARKIARDKANEHGGIVYLYPGSIKSGILPIYEYPIQ